MMDDADNSLFHNIIANKHHVLQRYSPDNPDSDLEDTAKL